MPGKTDLQTVKINGFNVPGIRIILMAIVVLLWIRYARLAVPFEGRRRLIR